MSKILVIEDELPLLEEVVDVLTFEGFDVTSASDGMAGLEQLEKSLPDLIISDIMMPRLDGYGVLAHLRASPATATIPFIFLTAKVEKQDFRHGMELGADDYLMKPFTQKELLAAVRTRLEKQTAVREANENLLNELRHTIITNLPHELRTPLNGVLGYAELLQMDAQTMSRDMVAEIGETIAREGKRLHRLIENYLLYAQIEIISADVERIQAMRAAGTEHPSETISFSAWHSAVVWQRETDLTLDVIDVPVAVEETSLKKIVRELTDNAFKFSAPGTEVRVACRMVGDEYAITIKDSGRGITPEQVGRIGAYMQFERKFHEQQGSGLGLIIAKQLIELHRGRLTFAPEVPGATVTVSLPLQSFPLAINPVYEQQLRATAPIGL